MNTSGYAFLDEDDCKKTSIGAKRCIDCNEQLTYKPERYIRCFHCNRNHWIKEENLKNDIKERRNERRALNIRPFMREAREG